MKRLTAFERLAKLEREYDVEIVNIQNTETNAVTVKLDDKYTMVVFDGMTDKQFNGEFNVQVNCYYCYHASLKTKLEVTL